MSEPGEWVTKGIAKARKLLHRSATDRQRELGETFLDQIEPHAAELDNVGRELLAAMLARLELGDDEGAKLLWLRTRATFAERLAASSASTGETLAKARRRAELWDDLQRLGTHVLKVALPLVVAAF